MLAENAPPPKRTKFNDYEFTRTLQYIDSDVQHALSNANDLKQLVDDDFSLPETGINLVNHVLSQVTHLQSYLKLLLGRFGKKHDTKTDGQSLFETIVNVIKAKLFGYLQPDTFLYLATASSTIHRVLSPFINELPIFLPPESNKIEFKFSKPTTLSISSQMVTTIPPHITKLVFSDDFNAPFHTLPSTITHITFGDSFNQTINYILPSSLTHLTFGHSFNQPVSYWPKKLSHLTFGDGFDSPLSNLPDSLTHLRFGFDFNQPLPKLPPNLYELRFGPTYNHPIDHFPDSIHTLETFLSLPVKKLPNSLTTLTFDSETNNLQCPLPSSLTSLQFAGDCNSIDFSKLPLVDLKIDGHTDFPATIRSLPPQLKKLRVQGKIELELDLLPNLTHLTVLSDTFFVPIGQLPTSITHLTLGLLPDPPHHIPSSVTHLFTSSAVLFEDNKLLTHLTFRDLFNRRVENLPENVTHLTFSNTFNKKVQHLPPNITCLTFGQEFNKSVNNLPPNITHLTFGNDFNHPVDNLPLAITHLFFGFDFNQPVNNLPPNISDLAFGHSFNQKVGKLPQKITVLSFGYSFNCPINCLPSSLKILKLGVKFNQPIYNLPASLGHLDMAGTEEILSQILLFPHTLNSLCFTFIPTYQLANNYNQFGKDDLPKQHPDIKNYALSFRIDFWKNKVDLRWISMHDFVDFFIHRCLFVY
eukprot:Phypoly_transcript_04785.p1 GENE.Phypoly_transcript_04785~~Phypoly_transcript_04785.p1  ORF type:complete len:698 (+),score=146.62 Phypoly_transcript_04785:6-2099(+)